MTIRSANQKKSQMESTRTGTWSKKPGRRTSAKRKEEKAKIKQKVKEKKHLTRRETHLRNRMITGGPQKRS